MSRPFSAADKLAAVEREVGQRQQVYGRLVTAGRMTAAFAREQIAVMEAIAEDYRTAAEKERLL